MSENNCYLCQEPKTVVGHNTQSCPNVKCKKCGQKGHIQKNCPNLNSDFDQKLNYICPKEIQSEHSIVLHDDTKTLDFVHDVEFSVDLKPKLEIKKENWNFKSSRVDQKPKIVNPIAPNEEKMMDFFHDIEFSDDIKPKLEIKEEKLKTEDNFKDKEEFDSLLKEYLKEYERRRKYEISQKYLQFYCKLCNVQSTSQVDLNNHRAGKKHKKNLKMAHPAPMPLDIELQGKNKNEEQHSNRADLSGHGTVMKDFPLEFAKSGASKCGVCKEKMKMGKKQFKKKYHCDVCHVNNSSQVSLKAHLVGKKHLIIQSRLLRKKDFKRRKQLEKEIRNSLV